MGSALVPNDLIPTLQGMAFDPLALPDDPTALRAAVLSMRAEIDEARAARVRLDAECAHLETVRGELEAELALRERLIEKLKLQIHRLKRGKFGASSEKLDRAVDQLELTLEDLAAVRGEIAARYPSPVPASETTGKPARRALPGHLPREECLHDVGCMCAACGNPMVRIGEDTSEVLEYVPASFRVIRHVRPKYACGACETVRQAAPADLPIERGRPGPGLLAHVLVAKYADHLPLHRQSGIYAREGVDIERSTLADWVGRAAWLLSPLAEAVGRHVLSGGVVHADDTPVPVLDPGLGRTKTGRLWGYVRDERPWAGCAAPAAFFRYGADRRGEHPQAHLGGFRGILQADGYGGFGKLYAPGADGTCLIREAACWAHARRKFFDIAEASGSAVAQEALGRIAELYKIEAAAVGLPAETRAAIRRAKARQLIDALFGWMEGQLPRLSGKSDLAEAIRYALSRREALCRYIEDGTIAIDNNAAERALRGIGLGRKNYLFAGSDRGGERAATIYTLIETAKLNGLDPEAYLRDVLGRIATHPIGRIDELLAWRWGNDGWAAAATEEAGEGAASAG